MSIRQTSYEHLNKFLVNVQFKIFVPQMSNCLFEAVIEKAVLDCKCNASFLKVQENNCRGTGITCLKKWLGNVF